MAENKFVERTGSDVQNLINELGYLEKTLDIPEDERWSIDCGDGHYEMKENWDINPTKIMYKVDDLRRSLMDKEATKNNRHKTAYERD